MRFKTKDDYREDMGELIYECIDDAIEIVMDSAPNEFLKLSRDEVIDQINDVWNENFNRGKL